MKRKTLITCVAAAGLGAGLLAWWSTAPRVDGRLSVPAQSSSPRDASMADRIVASGASTATRPALLPGRFDAQRAELEARAAGGDAAAAYRLGEVIALCLDYKPMPAGEFTAMLARLVAGVGKAARFGEEPLDSETTIDLFLFAYEEAERICDQTDGLRANPPTQDAFHWISRAAASGHPMAMARYGDVAFKPFKETAELLDNAAEVARRRELTRAYAERALRAGEPAALLALAKGHSAEGILEPDPVRALSYWLAYRQTAAAKRLPAAMLRMGEEKAAAGMSPSARALAEQEAQRLLSVVEPNGATR